MPRTGVSLATLWSFSLQPSTFFPSTLTVCEDARFVAGSCKLKSFWLGSVTAENAIDYMMLLQHKDPTILRINHDTVLRRRRTSRYPSTPQWNCGHLGQQGDGLSAQSGSPEVRLGAASEGLRKRPKTTSSSSFGSRAWAEEGLQSTDSACCRTHRMLKPLLTLL